MKRKPMTQQEIDEKYPLWKCEECAAHEYRVDKYGYSAGIYAVWNGSWGKCEEYLFLARVENAKAICKDLNKASREWKPKFNTLGALIN